MNNSKVIVENLGHLQVFHKTTQEHPMGDGRFYYYDKRFPVEVGPFDSVYAATEHWKGVLEHTNIDYQKDNLYFIEHQQKGELDNVIFVDFKMKRRIR